MIRYSLKRSCESQRDLTDIRRMTGLEMCDLKLKDLQPSQFCISEKKLSDIGRWFDPADLSGFDPVPVKILNGIPVMTDGHTRAVAAVLAGLDTVPIVLDEDDLDWDMYLACVKACRERNIFSPYDLITEIVPEEEYTLKWDRWCDIMQAEILLNRKQRLFP